MVNRLGRKPAAACAVNPLQQLLRADDQLPGQKRLGQIIVAAHLQAHDPVQVSIPGRYEDHGDRRIILLDLLDQLKSVHTGKHNIQNP
ncbi:hypothetical protein D3C76_1656270 [compost metagenome]